MAEALALGASLATFIQLADRVVYLARYYIEGIRDCPADIRATLVETSSLKAVLETLGFLLKNDTGHERAHLLLQLAGEHGPIEACRQSLVALEKLLPSDFKTVRGKRQKILTAAQHLAWPLKQASAKRLIEDMSRYKATIAFALAHDTHKDVRDIKKDLRRVNETISLAERNRICDWLESTNPSTDHNKALRLREDHTGLWMTCLPAWQRWLAGKEKFLWIHGIPGAGKTVLASFLVEQAKAACLRQNAADPSERQKHIVTVYYYCYYARNQDEAVPCLRWIVSQLCRYSGLIPCDIDQLFQLQHLPTVSELLLALEIILEEFEAVFILIDAVDESESRTDLLKVLRDLVTDHRFDRVRLLATSREYYDIETYFSSISREISMNNPVVSEDIRRYVHSALLSNRKFQSWPQSLVTEVEDALMKGAKGMFRWAVCQIDVLQRLGRESEIRDAISNLPRSLDETYERIFQLIPDEDWEFVRLALLFICSNNSVRPRQISSPVLLQAVLFRLKNCGGNSEGNNNDDVAYYDRDSLRDKCGCLIALSPYKDTEHVSLAHYTVKEFLYSDRIFRSPASGFALSETLVQTELWSMIFSILTDGPIQTAPKNPQSLLFYCLTLGAFSGINNPGEELLKSQPRFARFESLRNSISFLAVVLPVIRWEIEDCRAESDTKAQ